MRQISLVDSCETSRTIPNLIEVVKYTNDILQIEPISFIVGVTNEIKQPIDQIVSHWSLDIIDIWSVSLDLIHNIRMFFLTNKGTQFSMSLIQRLIENISGKTILM